MSERMSSFFRRARPAPPPPHAEPGAEEPAEVVGEAGAPPAPSPVPPGPGEMRRERRTLARRREIELRDVGGLTVEMIRRDRFKPELLISRGHEVLLVEQRMHELDALLAAEISVRGLRHVPHCKCGAPLPPGVHFCSHCGRPASAVPAVVSCDHCGQPLPADANFCPFCGNAAAEEQSADAETGAPLDSTLVRPRSDEERAHGA